MCRHGSTEQEPCQRRGAAGVCRYRVAIAAVAMRLRCASRLGLRGFARLRRLGVRTRVLAEGAFRRLVAAEDHDQHATIGVASLDCVIALARDDILRGRSRPAAPDPRRRVRNRCTTLAARAADSSQFDGNVRRVDGAIVGVAFDAHRVRILRERLGELRRARGMAGRTASATPLANRMSVRISTSTQVPCAAHRDQVGGRRAPPAPVSTSSATLASCWRHDDLSPALRLARRSCGARAELDRRSAWIASSIWRG